MLKYIKPKLFEISLYTLRFLYSGVCFIDNSFAWFNRFCSTSSESKTFTPNEESLELKFKSDSIQSMRIPGKGRIQIIFTNCLNSAHINHSLTNRKWNIWQTGLKCFFLLKRITIPTFIQFILLLFHCREVCLKMIMKKV